MMHVFRRLMARAQAVPAHVWLGIVMALMVMLPAVADARVGGGQSYSGGGSSGRSSGGGSSGGGDLTGIVLWLLIEHPAVGIPVLLVVVGVVVVKQYSESSGGFAPMSRKAPGVVRRDAPKPRADEGITSLKKRDPGFSEVLLIDLFQLIYTRGRRLAPSRDHGPLRAWFTSRGLEQLAKGRPLKSLEDVIFGSVRPVEVRQASGMDRVTIEVDTNLRGATPTGDDVHVLRRERWVLVRTAGTVSPGPERMRTLSCVACGSAEEPDPTGICRNCGEVRVGPGSGQWAVDEVTIVEDRVLRTVEVHPGGGVEPGYHHPDVVDRELALHRREFTTRHPDHSWPAFEQRVTKVFVGLQQAWSDQRFQRARAWQTDNLFQVHRFWLERYKKDGLVNKLDDITVQCVRVVRVDRDAWYESVVVRVFASVRDWTERIDTGEVLGGSRTEPRVFSEYWTFVRAIGAESRAASHDLESCPSCGAPLDKLSMAGICGYCEAKITTGTFDWVLSRIEQDEAYKG